MNQLKIDLIIKKIISKEECIKKFILNKFKNEIFESLANLYIIAIGIKDIR